MFAEELIGGYVAEKRAASPDGKLVIRHSCRDRRRKTRKTSTGDALRGVMRAASKKHGLPRHSLNGESEAAVEKAGNAKALALPKPKPLPKPKLTTPPHPDDVWQHVSSPTFPSRADLGERPAYYAIAKASRPPPLLIPSRHAGRLPCLLTLVWVVMVVVSTYALGNAVVLSLNNAVPGRWYWWAGAACLLLALLLAPNTLGRAVIQACIRSAISSRQQHPHKQQAAPRFDAPRKSPISPNYQRMASLASHSKPYSKSRSKYGQWDDVRGISPTASRPIAQTKASSPVLDRMSGSQSHRSSHRKPSPSSDSSPNGNGTGTGVRVYSRRSTPVSHRHLSSSGASDPAATTFFAPDATCSGAKVHKPISSPQRVH